MTSYANSDGVVIVQVLVDTYGYPDRDPVVTFFDASDTPVAMLTGAAGNFKATGDGRCVLYTRDGHDVASSSSFVTDSGANHKADQMVDAVKTLQNPDGSYQVMSAAGLIRRRFTGDGSPFGLYSVGEGAKFNETDCELLFHTGTDMSVSNASGEKVAFRTLNKQKINSPSF